MNVKSWYEKRGLKFVYQRGLALLDRYGLSSRKAFRRIEACLETLAASGCAPTFPTPGYVVERYPTLIQQIQKSGAEIAVHSYHHIDLSELPFNDAIKQLTRAVETFERFGIEAHGFRCPYMGCNDELLKSLPAGMFDYSSNRAIRWEPANMPASVSLFYETLHDFYHGSSAAETVCVPTTHPNFIEIPVCVPDDLQLRDGLNLNPEGISQIWNQLLDQVHQRGELFTLLFHPELASFCESPFVSLLQKAHQIEPTVWIARLSDISRWWREKADFAVEVVSDQRFLKLSFRCSPRATILAKGLDLPGGSIWDGAYYRLESNALEAPLTPLPFIGIADSVPEHTLSFLREQGYILETGEKAEFCGIVLNTDTVARIPNNLELIEYIETTPAPLVRYWRWPDGAKSALSVTGDLDALSLMDYASRLFIR